LKLGPSLRYSESSEQERLRYVILYVSLVSYLLVKGVERGWPCTLILREHSDLRDWCLLLRDMDWLSNRFWIMWPMRELITLISRISYYSRQLLLWLRIGLHC